MNNKGLTPLVATVSLVLLSLIIGTITMNFGKTYVQELSGEDSLKGTVVIDLGSVDTELKELQLKHITGSITEEEYLEKEKQLIVR